MQKRVDGFFNYEFRTYIAIQKFSIAIYQPKDELGKLAIDMLLYRMDNPDSEPKQLVLTPKLIERDSVGQR
ncbi:substrate-binding domain-containing protein [Xenorhabdus sp. BG5]|uniref:substrate-binding domain-containing protein n=1 Tax=Xenorhabdus sp. BG5 TaxID=2782014 RepID=UPI00351C10BF